MPGHMTSLLHRLLLIAAASALAIAAAEAADPSPDDAELVGEPEEEVVPEEPAPKRRAPCPELEGPETPRLDNFQLGVERSVCVTAWYFDRLFGVLPEN